MTTCIEFQVKGMKAFAVSSRIEVNDSKLFSYMEKLSKLLTKPYEESSTGRKLRYVGAFFNSILNEPSSSGGFARCAGQKQKITCKENIFNVMRHFALKFVLVSNFGEETVQIFDPEELENLGEQQQNDIAEVILDLLQEPEIRDALAERNEVERDALLEAFVAQVVAVMYPPIEP